MKILYGIAVQESDDPYIAMAEEALNGVAEAGIPGAFWVDMFPILKYVPSWFPGAGFQKKAARWREVNHNMAEKPFRHVQEQLVLTHKFIYPRELMSFFFEQMILQKNGKATSSMTASLIERLPDEGDPQRSSEEWVARNVAWAAYAGTWCTLANLGTFRLILSHSRGFPSQVALIL